jgi:hypothetical protein
MIAATAFCHHHGCIKSVADAGTGCRVMGAGSLAGSACDLDGDSADGKFTVGCARALQALRSHWFWRCQLGVVTADSKNPR